MKSKKNGIGDRVFIENDDAALFVRIKPFREPVKQGVLSVWTFLWSLCGGVVLFYLLLGTAPREEKLVLFVFLVFWGYFEFMVLKAFFWRRSGEERIRIDEKGVSVEQIAPLFKRRHVYEPGQLRSVRFAERKEASFQEQFENAYYVIGAFKLEFVGGGKRTPFGEKLDKKEGEKLLSLLKKRLSVEKS